MTWNAGTATDYLDLLDQLEEVITSDHVASIALVAGGSGYEANEILDLDGSGTFTHAAQIEVLTVDGGGAVLTARVYRGGAYTADPDLTANATATTDLLADGSAVATTGATGATFDLTMASTGWTKLTKNSEAVSAVVGSSGGSGYTNGSTDVLTVVGGVLAEGGSAATFTATVSGGIVTSVALLSAGEYEVTPANDALTTVSPSGGTGCVLTVTWAETTGQDTIAVFQGDAGASTDPLVGIKTYSSETDQTGLNTVYNWAMFSMTSWSASSALHQQANVSDGFNAAADGTITASGTGDGAFVPLKNDAVEAFEWAIRANGRNVSLFTKVSGASTNHVASCSFGLMNQFGTTTELPYPAYVSGTSDRKRVWNEDIGSIFGGQSFVISRANGPMFVWAPEGTWLSAKNATIGGNTSTTPTHTGVGNSSPRVNVWPLGPNNTHENTEDQIFNIAGAEGFDMEDLTLSTGATQIYRTPDTGGDLFPLFPVTVVQSDSASDFFRVFGELDGLFWFSGNDASISNGDRFTQGDVAYTIFQNGTRTDPFAFIAVRED